jgi:outer membrane protein TolC
MYFVLQAQTDLANAQSTLVTQSISYRRAQLNLLRYTGELLEERGVAVQ